MVPFGVAGGLQFRVEVVELEEVKVSCVGGEPGAVEGRGEEE